MRAFTQADRRAMGDPLHAQRYGRAAAHDSRFDGCFVIGIPMSEIFCRPGCATRTPRPSRVVFYPTAAAAHETGLTPCPRCRPDATCAAPWVERADTLAARALRLIADREIERTGVGGVARLLGVTTRQVLRAVEAQTGCGPLAVARAARAHLARLLLTQTSIPIAEVAWAAGFTSVRQFNSTILRFYAMTPGAIRGGVRGPGRVPGRVPARGAGRGAGTGVGAGAGARAGAGTGIGSALLVLRCPLPVRQSFDAAAVLGALAGRAIVGVEEGGAHWYARTVRLPHGAGHVRVDGVGPHTPGGAGRVGVLAEFRVADARDIGPLYTRVRRLLDLDAGGSELEARPSRVPAPAPGAVERQTMPPAGAVEPQTMPPAGAVERQPVQAPGALDIEEALFRTAIARTSSAFAGRALLNRLARQLGEPTPWGLLFPTSDAIAARARTVLTGPAERLDTVAGIAETIIAMRPRLHVGSSRAEWATALAAVSAS